MSLSDVLIHLLNFVAPAFMLAVLLPSVSRLFVKRSAFLLAWWVQVLLNLLAGVAVLSGAVWWLGRDGKMTGYAVLVLVLASLQWLWVRGWRR